VGENKGAEAWEAKFEELVKYRKDYGDCLVPTKYAENEALGRWVSTQRAQYKLWRAKARNPDANGRKSMSRALIHAY